MLNIDNMGGAHILPSAHAHMHVSTGNAPNGGLGGGAPRLGGCLG